MGFVTALLPGGSISPQPELVVDTSIANADEAVRFTSEPNLKIEDEQTVVDTLQVSESGLAFQVKLNVSIEHSYIGDLVVELEHDGFRATVFRNVGTGAAQLDRSFEFDVPRGIERSGEWRLILKDTAAQDEGVLLAWSLVFED